MTFVDSGALIAYFHGEDPFYDAACEGFALLGKKDEPAATTALCVAEAVSALARKTTYAGAARSGADILEWNIEILRPSLVEEKRALRLMESYADKGVSFVDCVSFVLMDARKIDTAFTFDDEHFVKLRKLKPWVPIPRGKRAR